MLMDLEQVDISGNFGVVSNWMIQAVEDSDEQVLLNLILPVDPAFFGLPRFALRLSGC